MAAAHLPTRHEWQVGPPAASSFCVCTRIGLDAIETTEHRGPHLYMQHNDAPGVWTLPTSVRGLWRPPLCYCRVSAFQVALSALGRGFPVCPSRAANRVWTLPTTPWTLPTGRHRKINELPDISRGLCRTNK